MGNKEHSFYTENKKSLNNDSYDSKKTLKSIGKYTKWALYAFLTVTTLWGCVNQFRHTTNQAVSQGIEFYKNYDEVLPNLYSGVSTTYTYEVVGEDTISSPDESINGNVEVLKPLEYYVINPFYGNEDVNDSVDTINPFIKSADKKTATGSNNFGKYAYSINMLQAINLFLIDWSNYSYEDVILPWNFALLSSETRKEIAPDSIYDDEENITTLEFYNALLDTSKIDNDEYEKLTYLNDEGERLPVDSNEAYLVPETIDVDGSVLSWNVIEGISFKTLSNEEFIDMDDAEKEELAKERVIFLTNLMAFISPNATFDSSMLIELEDGESKTIIELVEEGFNNDSVIDNYLSSYSYNVEYTPLQQSSYFDGELKAGMGYTIIPQNKAKAIFPSNQALKEVKSERESSSWKSEFIETKAGTINRTDKAGWSIMEYNSESERWDNIKLINSSGEENILYSNNKEEFVVEIDEYQNGDYFVEKQIELNFGIESFEKINYNADFIGLVGSSEVVGSSTTKVPSGITPSYEWVKNDETEEWEISISSKIDDVIKESGQSSKNSSRSIFTSSMSDWGDAWDANYGPMYGMFVWPLAQLSLFIQNILGSIEAWAIILGIFLITFLLRGLGFLMSIGSSKNQSKTQELQPQIAEINAKYAKYDKSNKQMKQKKQQETMALYRKHGVNPFSSIGTIFITLPIFLSIWTIISSLPAYKVASVGSFVFSVSSLYGMFNTGSLFFAYLLVGLSVGLMQGISTKLPTWLANKRKGIKRVDEATKEAMKKQNKTQNILVGVFIFMGLTVQVLLAIYWMFSSLFTMVVELAKHMSKQHKAKKIKNS